MGAIYAGNVLASSHYQAASGVVSKYMPFIDQQAPYELPELLVEPMHQACKSCLQTSAGPDGWTCADMRHSTRRSARWLARMLRAIELGALWPWQLTSARAIS